MKLFGNIKRDENLFKYGRAMSALGGIFNLRASLKGTTVFVFFVDDPSYGCGQQKLWLSN